jgi:hypothetical protein
VKKQAVSAFAQHPVKFDSFRPAARVLLETVDRYHLGNDSLLLDATGRAFTLHLCVIEIDWIWQHVHAVVILQMARAGVLLLSPLPVAEQAALGIGDANHAISSISSP